MAAAPSMPIHPVVRNGSGEAADDDSITRIGPTRRLTLPPAGSADEPPPQGEKERLIWAMEQCG